MKIEKETDRYSYSFVTNRDIDTPLNLARKQRSRKYFFFIIAIGIAIVLLVSGLTYWML